MCYSDKYPYEKKYTTIFEKKMAYMTHGEGDPIVFLHGNPTSSYIWRNILPYLEGKGRLIAPDLIGMGDSEKLDHSGPDRYTYAEQKKYLFGLLEELGVNENVTLVIQDWGGCLGFNWAHEHADAIKGIAFMEVLVAPILSWDDFPKDFHDAIKAFRSDVGEDLVLKQNIFIEQVLPAGIVRKLSEHEMAEYRRPFLEEGESRRPSLSFSRHVPIAGDPVDVWKITEEFSSWLSHTQFPKLFIDAQPGSLINDQARTFIRSWPQVTEVTVPGHHFVQEDSPDEIGESIAKWYETLNPSTYSQ